MGNSSSGGTALYEAALEGVLLEWAESIRAHEPERVAAVFTTDAVFQGSDPTYAVGRSGVAAYYQRRPVGLSPEYRIREIRGLGPDAFVALVDVDFRHADGAVNRTRLSLAVIRDGAWFIEQYHVSQIAREA